MTIHNKQIDKDRSTVNSQLSILNFQLSTIYLYFSSSNSTLTI
ncbi:MAG: hypothetical protein ACRC62_16705 [Microcoleus sp.]